MKRPETIILTLVGATVVGTAGMALFNTPEKPPERVPPLNDWTSQSEMPPVSEDQEYPNNTYVPGAGYYHAPYHSFFPYRYNYLDSGRGYYHGGSWWPQASTSNISSSRPTYAAAASARTAQSSRSSGSSLAGGSTGKGSSSSGTSHGGFGSTGHASSGGSSSS